MKVYFAAVGSDLWECLERAAEATGSKRRVLFSYYDMDLGGFQFRRKSWEQLTGEPFDRKCWEQQKIST